MSSISQCENDIRRYKVLKENINSVVEKLSLAVSNASTLNTELKNKYQVDDSNTPISNRVKDLKNNIENTSNFLKDKVISEIDGAINNLNREIARLEEEEREARDRALRESAAAAAKTTSATTSKSTTTSTGTKSSTKVVVKTVSSVKPKTTKIFEKW